MLETTPSASAPGDGEGGMKYQSTEPPTLRFITSVKMKAKAPLKKAAASIKERREEERREEEERRLQILKQEEETVRIDRSAACPRG